MAEFNLEEAQAFQNRIIDRVRETQRMLDRDVIEYYRQDRVESSQDMYENLHGLHNYLKRSYDELGRLMTEIENRAEYR